MLKKIIWANFQRIIDLFTQKVVKKLSKIWVWDPGSRGIRSTAQHWLIVEHLVLSSGRRDRRRDDGRGGAVRGSAGAGRVSAGQGHPPHQDCRRFRDGRSVCHQVRSFDVDNSARSIGMRQYCKNFFASLKSMKKGVGSGVRLFRLNTCFWRTNFGQLHPDPLTSMESGSDLDPKHW
jgi:hypothetical protein